MKAASAADKACDRAQVNHNCGFTRERRGGARKGRSSVVSALPQRPDSSTLSRLLRGIRKEKKRIDVVILCLEIDWETLSACRGNPVRSAVCWRARIRPKRRARGVTICASSAESSRAPSGQVFATQVKEQPIPVPNDIVAGIVFIRGTRARATFDTGASHSFIDASFAKTHDIEITHNEEYWSVNTPEHSFHVHDECLACPVQIGD
uniref:Uncharacterized protein n=1 Tax=Ananas comosus var. bracteatus TaxID=296719 RepID=A0A6V7PFE9_ANACO|nr:unnamed protein product [Ananas comosus var. bracteatus]